MSNGQRELHPPEGLSLREQARWWCCEPEALLVAFRNDSLSDDAKQAIECVAKDNDLAHKVIDSKVVPGLSASERARLFELLTDGGTRSSQPSKRGPKRKIKHALDVADSIAGLQGREANQTAREAAGNKYYGNTSKLKQMVKQASDERQAASDLITETNRNISDYIQNNPESVETALVTTQMYLELLTKINDISPDLVELLIPPE